MSRWTDSLIFATANAFLYAKTPRYARRYRRHVGRWPNVANPQRYSERMLWRKLVDHSPQHVLFSDKLATKEFIQRRCPDLRLPRTLWIGDDADAIPDEVLRGDVFVKANHGCDYNYRVRNGRCDRADLREKTRLWLGSIHGEKYGEWAYSQIKPKLFIEEAVGDAAADLLEFNVRACNGQAILGSIMGFCKMSTQWAAYFDPEGQPTHGMSEPDGCPIATPRAEALAALDPYRRAVEFSRRLSVGVDYARFDFFWNGKELFGSEITVYPARGVFDPANTTTHALILNGWDLLQSHFLQAPQTGWKQLYAEALKRQLKMHPAISTSRGVYATAAGNGAA